MEQKEWEDGETEPATSSMKEKKEWEDGQGQGRWWKESGWREGRGQPQKRKWWEAGGKQEGKGKAKHDDKTKGRWKKSPWASLKWGQSKGLGKDQYGGELVKGGYKDAQGQIWELLGLHVQMTCWCQVRSWEDKGQDAWQRR